LKSVQNDHDFVYRSFTHEQARIAWVPVHKLGVLRKNSGAKPPSQVAALEEHIKKPYYYLATS
jgi:hypothetical protein